MLGRSETILSGGGRMLWGVGGTGWPEWKDEGLWVEVGGAG